MEEFETSFKRFVFNRLVPFPQILAWAGIERTHYNGNICCPFHPNTNTPAARLYRGEEGDRLYCYAERKQFRPYDVIRLGLFGADTREAQEALLDKYFQRIWNALSPQQKQELISQQEVQAATFDDRTLAILNQARPFSQGLITYRELRAILVQI